jgi:hypothetical protein
MWTLAPERSSRATRASSGRVSAPEAASGTAGARVRYLPAVLPEDALVRVPDRLIAAWASSAKAVRLGGGGQ